MKCECDVVSLFWSMKWKKVNIDHCFVIFVALCCVNNLLKGKIQYIWQGSNELLHVCYWYHERCFKSCWLLKGWIATTCDIILLVGGNRNRTITKGGDRNRKKSFFFYTSVIRNTPNPDWNIVKSRMSLFEGVVKVREYSVYYL